MRCFHGLLSGCNSQVLLARFQYWLVIAMVLVAGVLHASPPKTNSSKPMGIDQDAPPPPLESEIGPLRKGDTVVAEGGSVQLSLHIPGKVSRSRSSLQIGDKTFAGLSWTSNVEKTRYLANVITLPQNANETFSKDVARRQAEVLAIEIKGLSGKPKLVEFSVFEGFEYDVVGGVWKGGRASARLRTFYAGNFVLTMTIVQSGATLDEKAVKGFFKSLIYASIDRIQPEENGRRP